MPIMIIYETIKKSNGNTYKKRQKNNKTKKRNKTKKQIEKQV